MKYIFSETYSKKNYVFKKYVFNNMWYEYDMDVYLRGIILSVHKFQLCVIFPNWSETVEGTPDLIVDHYTAENLIKTDSLIQKYQPRILWNLKNKTNPLILQLTKLFNIWCYT